MKKIIAMAIVAIIVLGCKKQDNEVEKGTMLVRIQAVNIDGTVEYSEIGVVTK